MKLAAILGLLFLVSCCQAKTLIVDPNGGDAKTLLDSLPG
jgi:hypothetical protein